MSFVEFASCKSTDGTAANSTTRATMTTAALQAGDMAYAAFIRDAAGAVESGGANASDTGPTNWVKRDAGNVAAWQIWELEAVGGETSFVWNWNTALNGIGVMAVYRGPEALTWTISGSTPRMVIAGSGAQFDSSTPDTLSLTPGSNGTVVFQERQYTTLYLATAYNGDNGTGQYPTFDVQTADSFRFRGEVNFTLTNLAQTVAILDSTQILSDDEALTVLAYQDENVGTITGFAEKVFGLNVAVPTFEGLKLPLRRVRVNALPYDLRNIRLGGEISG